ncbi:metallophosphoesterase family protein [Chthonobacter albigriseus]|uniref:metallophosphoesterase family protein n=1 Tax=Chthonobacter albigriseus TaxID=1683161 RepID=UPI0015EFB7E5|nr:DNA repair exonuclease [Chthonobacter albigriseus]
MSLRFLHTADLHLGSPLKGLGARNPELADLFARASRRAFDALIDTAIAEKVAFVVIAGDVYDQDWTDYAIGQTFLRGITRLTRAGIRTVVIRGNHDAEHVITRSLVLPEGITWLGADKPETVDFADIGVAVHGMSFKTRSVTENMVPRYPSAVAGRFNIGLLHTSLDGRPDHTGYAPCAIADLAHRGYGYWALGHIHAREVVHRADPTVVYAGNIQGRHARETGAKSATLVTVEGDRVVELETRAVDAARWAAADLDASGLETREDLAARARLLLEDVASKAEGRPVAVRLRLVGQTRLHQALAADRDRLVADLELAAAGVSETLALERVTTATAPLRAEGPAAPALDDIDEAFAAALADPALAATLEADFALLRTKLPAGVQERLEQEPADALLAAARALLEGRLGETA